jgi:hypothetical protein
MKKVGQSGGTTENGRYASGQMYRVPSEGAEDHDTIIILYLRKE